MTTKKPKTNSRKKEAAADPTAALRQQRRRARLKESGARTVTSLLDKERGKKMDALLAARYEETQGAVLAKGLDEAYANHIKKGQPPQVASVKPSRSPRRQKGV